LWLKDLADKLYVFVAAVGSYCGLTTWQAQSVLIVDERLDKQAQQAMVSLLQSVLIVV
jgi:hypothetical protein